MSVFREDSKTGPGALSRESEERFRALVENSSDGVVVVAADGLICYSSPAAAQILGYEGGELLGTSARDLVLPEDLGIAQEAARRLLGGAPGPVHLELRLLGKDGAPREIEMSIVDRRRLPVIGGVVVNFRDVSERNW